MRWLLVLSLSAVVFLAGAPGKAKARLARRGGEFQINTVPGGDQASPQVAALPDGGFFVVWRRGGDLMARRFSSASEPLTPELVVNDTVPDTDPGHRLAVSSDGSVLVAWCSVMPPNSTGVIARRYDATGAPDGPPFNVLDRGSYWGIAVGGLVAGEFVVAWIDTDTHQARLRIVGPSELGPSISVTHDVSPVDLAIGSTAENEFQLLWYEEESAVLQGRSFDPERPVGNTFDISLVNSSSHQGPAACSWRSGGFVVAWVSLEYGPHSDGFLPIRYRRYDPQSMPLSPQLAVTPDEIDEGVGNPSQATPAVACGGSGEFSVAWIELENPTFSVRGKRFIDDAPGSIFRVHLEGEPAGLAVTRVTGGDDVLIWSECSAASGCNVFGQRYTPDRVDQIPSDCDGDGAVSIDELITVVTTALAGDPPVLIKKCLAADVSLDYTISIDEVLLGVHWSLAR